MAQLTDLPHRHPFRFVYADAEGGDDPSDSQGRIQVLLTPGGPWARGGRFPDFFALEILSQATAVLLAHRLSPEAETPPSQPGYLAGVSDFHLQRRLNADDRLEVSATLEGRFGSLIRVHAMMTSAGAPVADAKLLLGVGGIH